MTRLAAAAAAVVALWLLGSAAATVLAAGHPPIPTGADGPVPCATCHGPAAQPPSPELLGPPLPADHAGRAAEQCATCHADVATTAPKAASYAQCATCHAGAGQTATLGDGQTITAAVDLPRYLASVHGSFSCTVCHPGQTTIPHAPLTAEGKRAFTQEMAEVCQTCHAGPTASYEESFHGRAAALGLMRAATCTDCHTAHDVQAPATWSLADRAASCSVCHTGATPSFAAGWMGHREPSPAWFPAVFYAGKGFVALTAIVVGLGIVHVELDLLRWGWDTAVRRTKEEDEE